MILRRILRHDRLISWIMALTRRYRDALVAHRKRSFNDVDQLSLGWMRSLRAADPPIS